MNETTAFNDLATTLNLSGWWTDLLGHTGSADSFDFRRAEDKLPRTELTAAQAIQSKLQNYVSYVAAEDRWYIWDGRVHAPCVGDGIAVKAVKHYAAATIDALAFIKSQYERKADHAKTSGKESAAADAKAILAEYDRGEISKHKRFRDRLASEAGIAAMVRILKSELDVAADHFEDDRRWFVVRNGVIDLHAYRASSAIELLPHDSSRAVTRYFDADYDPQATFDSWQGFLSSSIVDDGGDTVKLLQKAVGAAFSGEEKPRALFNLLGAPASGKSVFLSVFNKLGQDYSVMPNNQAIQLNNGDTNFYQDALRGKRFVGFSEVQGKKPLDDGFIKGIMGGDEQTTRKMRQMEQHWKPQCVMFIASNLELKFNTRDEATFVKILPIPFPHSFTMTDPEHLMDRELESKILAERSGVLTWVLHGMVGFWLEGLDPTAAVMAAMDGNKTANSSALQFTAAMMEAGFISQDLSAPTSSCLPLGAGYDVFKTWASSQGIKNVPGKQTFSEDIAGFYHGKKRSGTWVFEGLKMSEEVSGKVRNRIDLYVLAEKL